MIKVKRMDKDLEVQPVSNVLPPRNNQGWDGKLRIEKRATVANAEILSDPEYSDEDAPPVEQIDADEGISHYISQCCFF